MKTRAVIAAELRQALRTIEMTPIFLQTVRTGSITSEDLVRFLEDALAVALEQVYLDFAERRGGLRSVRQLAGAERAILFRDISEGSLELVQDVAGRVRDGWSDDKLSTELRRAILLNSKDAKAISNYDEELKTGDPKAKRRKLRDRRFAQKADLSPARRALMVNRYRDRLVAARTSSLARDQARVADDAVEFARWMELFEDGAEEARGARKFWVNRQDGKVRDSHVYVAQDYPDGLPLDEPFVTKWGLMRYPHDSQGHPKDRHGCRCRFEVRKASR